MKIFFKIILFLLAGQFAVVGIAQTPTTSRATAEYLSTSANIEKEFTGNQLLDLQKNYEILLIPGFLNELLIEFGASVQPTVNLGGYFDDQIEWLEANGISYRRVPVEPAATSAVNGKIIADTVNAASKPVILVSHSKGGPDTIEALLRSGADLSRIRGWISLQGAFYGSPVADSFTNNPVLSLTSKLIIKKINSGVIESLEGLRTDQSAYRMGGDLKALENLRRAFPIISFGSWITDATYKFNGWTIPFVTGVKTDSLVPLSSTYLPGSEWVTVANVDHAALVMNCYSLHFDRVRFLKTMLTMILRRIPD